MLYILDKHCTTCIFVAIIILRTGFMKKKFLSFVSQVLMRSKWRRKPHHAFSATSATASTCTTRRTVPHKRNPQTCLRTPHTTGAVAANDRTATSVKRSVTGQTLATMTKPSELPLSPSACEQAMHSTLSTRLYAIFVHSIYTFEPLVHSLNESAQMKVKVCCIYGIWMLWRQDIFLLSILFCVSRTSFTALC